MPIHVITESEFVFLALTHLRFIGVSTTQQYFRVLTRVIIKPDVFLKSQSAGLH